MAGASETLLEARIISTAFGCLSSRSAGGDRSGTNTSSRPGPQCVCHGVCGGWGQRRPGSTREMETGEGLGPSTLHHQGWETCPGRSLVQRSGLRCSSVTGGGWARMSALGTQQASLCDRSQRQTPATAAAHPELPGQLRGPPLIMSAR